MVVLKKLEDCSYEFEMLNYPTSDILREWTNLQRNLEWFCCC